MLSDAARPQPYELATPIPELRALQASTVRDIAALEQATEIEPRSSDLSGKLSKVCHGHAADALEDLRQTRPTGGAGRAARAGPLVDSQAGPVGLMLVGSRASRTGLSASPGTNNGALGGQMNADTGGVDAFDLNIGKVLEHWTVPFAIREIIANALDEAALTGTADPDIVRNDPGSWHIRDFGRGLRYAHLTQNESAEKRKHGGVVGQFGMGLKDALATFDRRGIEVTMRSRYCDITTGRHGKAGRFSDVITLHALVGPPSDPGMIGTDIVLSGVTDDQVAAAKRFFLRYSDDQVLEQTRYGQVLEQPSGRAAGRVYVKGLLVAEEPNFLFSYNITDLNAPLRRALNRERTNVGRTAYADRVKKILIECASTQVARPLADVAAFTSGRQHDELAWTDVALHACRVLQSQEKILFVTAWQLAQGTAQLRYAQDDGYRLVTVPDDIARRLSSMTDLTGQPMVDLSRYQQEWNDSFTYKFVAPDELTSAERQVFDQTQTLLGLVGCRLGKGRVQQVLVSQTMRLSAAGDMVLGMWEPDDQRIVVRRSELATVERYAGTLLHEYTHAKSGHDDRTLEFEQALSAVLGHLAAGSVASAGPAT
jgi:hypothetical protein